jgi:pyridoxine 4-dehydrogenase
VDAARASARRLRRDKLDLVQCHWSTSNYAPWQEQVCCACASTHAGTHAACALSLREAHASFLHAQALVQGMGDVYDAGLAGGVGVSNYGVTQLRKVHAALAARGVPLVSAQVQYSLLSRDPERSGMREACDELGVRLIAYSPLCLGALSGKYDADGALPAGPRGLLLRSLLRDATPLLALQREIAAARGVSPPQVAVNWCRAKGALPIPGVRSVAQARDALACLAWALDDGEVAELDAVSARCKGTVQNVFQTA